MNLNSWIFQSSSLEHDYMKRTGPRPAVCVHGLPLPHPTLQSVDMLAHSLGCVFPTQKATPCPHLGMWVWHLLYSEPWGFGKQAMKGSWGSLGREFWANQNMSRREMCDSWLIEPLYLISFCTLGERYRKEALLWPFKAQDPGWRLIFLV